MEPRREGSFNTSSDRRKVEALTLWEDGGLMITEALVTAAAGGVITEHLLGGLITDSLSKFAWTRELSLMQSKAGSSKPTKFIL